MPQLFWSVQNLTFPNIYILCITWGLHINLYYCADELIIISISQAQTPSVFFFLFFSSRGLDLNSVKCVKYLYGIFYNYMEWI